MKNDFEILIIGTDINAYTIARCYHEQYGKKANLIGKEEMKFTSLSSIVQIEYEPNLWDTETFKKTLKTFALNHPGKKILLIGTNDFYVRLIAENKDFLKKWYVFNYPNIEIVNNFLKKDAFYEKYKDILDVPKTYLYSCKEKKLNLDLRYPIIVKPGNGVTYYKHKFVGQSKVYRIKSEAELHEVIQKIEDSGYEDQLILQEFIPGDDDCLSDCIFYCNQKGKAEFASFAQIGLQEHTNTGVGNCTVLVNGYNEHGIPEELIYQLKDFLESIHYTGFAEFDLKFDARDGKYKIFEINPRQARCSYYLAFCGYNLVKYLVDDLIYKKTKKFEIIKEKKALSFVPNTVIKNCVKSEKLKKELNTLRKQKKICNPLLYKNDQNFKRKIYLFLRKINYMKKYKNQNWW